MFPVNKRYFNNDGFTSKSRVENPYSPSDADNIILKDPALDFRVLNLTLDPYNDASTSYFHKSIGGYHGAKLRRYQELIDHGIDQDIQTFIKSMSTLNTPVLNMLNTRYLIIPGQDKRPAAYPNTNALGNAWFAKNYQLVDNADAEIAAMKDFKPDSVVIVNKSFADQLKGFQPACDSSDVINLINYEPNKLMYEYTSRNKALAVFSEIYYPKGWNAFVDGQPAPHFRANYVLRAMILPEGNHKIEFRFEPVVYSMGETISLVSSLIVIALVLIAIFFEFWKTRKSQA